jgi:Fe-S cluster assembly protein SufD
MDGATKLAGVNEMLTPTWNYLHINDISVDVPLAGTSPSYAPAEKIPGGTGPETSAWLSRSATERTTHVINHGKHPEAPIEVLVSADDAQIQDTLIELRDGSEANVVVVASSKDDAEATCGSRLRLDLAAGAKAHLSVYVAMHDGYQYIDDIGVRLADDASVDVRYYLMGAGLTVCGLRTENLGFRSSVDVDVRYVSRASQTLDMNYILRLAGAKSTADLNAYGVLFDSARKTLRDTIDLMHAGRGAVGNENETVLLAGKDVVNKSLPIILCDEEDVVGNHGASIGSVSDEQLQYLRARGLDDEAAKGLFARSVIDAALSSAPTEAARSAALFAAARFAGTGADAADEFADSLAAGQDEEA